MPDDIDERPLAFALWLRLDIRHGDGGQHFLNQVRKNQPAIACCMAFSSTKFFPSTPLTISARIASQ
ncbi:hypothetical protein CWO90_17555 [Bradyrhizobium sp. Leo121]|nr:hypothetical protein CWO90_17555 [Bradyrhizobium sp. Leo121]